VKKGHTPQQIKASADGNSLRNSPWKGLSPTAMVHARRASSFTKASRAVLWRASILYPHEDANVHGPIEESRYGAALAIKVEGNLPSPTGRLNACVRNSWHMYSEQSTQWEAPALIWSHLLETERSTWGRNSRTCASQGQLDCSGNPRRRTSPGVDRPWRGAYWRGK